MKLSTLLFVVCFATLGAGNVDLPQSNSPNFKDLPCGRILPELVELSSGIDITKIDLFPEKPNHDRGFRAPLFEFTCNQRLNVTHPERNELYDQPDQIKLLQLSTLKEEFFTTYYNRMKVTYAHSQLDYKSQIYIRVGIHDLYDNPLFVGFGSESGHLRHLKKSIFGNGKQMATVKQYSH